jgi:uncharacterized integral membrane protein
MKNYVNSFYGTSAKVLIGIFIAIIITFLIQNWGELNEPTTIKLIGAAEYSLWVWLLLTFVAGNIAWMIISFRSRRKLKKTISQQQKELSDLRGELDKLRNLSLTDDVKTIESVSPPEATPDKNDQ